MPAPKGNKNAKGNKGGRPTDYRPEYAEQAYKLALLGMSNEEIVDFMADFWNIKARSIYNWFNDHVEFLQAVKRGGAAADAEIAQSLSRRAKGYTYREVREEWDENEQITKRVVYVKEQAPDPGAALNWLKNRQKDRWRDKVEHEHSGKVDSEITYKATFGDGSSEAD